MANGGILKSLGPYKSKAQLAYEAIKESIISGGYPPGTRLVLADLAARLEVSVLPVREALKRLEVEGYVVNKPNVGAMVSSISPLDMAEVIQVRRVLEGLAAREAAGRIGTEALERLAAILAEMRSCVEQSEHEEFGRLNKRFHQEVYVASGNSCLLGILSELWAKVERSRAVFVLAPQRSAQALIEHHAIYEALRQHDADLADRLMQEHRERAGAELLRSLMQRNEEGLEDREQTLS